MTSKKNHQKRCVTLFSGGRDSTLASVRLAAEGYEQILVTVTSEHLFGVARVKDRISEISDHLVSGSEWLLVRQPSIETVSIGLESRTCLPCHLAYLSVGLRLALDHEIDVLAFGYSGYQAHWPEQRPEAVRAMSKILSSSGIKLLTPVYEMISKESVIKQLRECGLSHDALEQKCSLQLSHLDLDDQGYRDQLDIWTDALRRTLASGPTAAVLVERWELNRGTQFIRQKQ